MKTILNLYIDGEIKSLAKSKGINMSRAFQEFLSLELEILSNKKKLSEKEEIGLLKQKLALLSAELSKKNDETEKLNKKIKEPKSRLTETGVRF